LYKKVHLKFDHKIRDEFRFLVIKIEIRLGINSLKYKRR